MSIVPRSRCQNMNEEGVNHVLFSTDTHTNTSSLHIIPYNHLCSCTKSRSSIQYMHLWCMQEWGDRVDRYSELMRPRILLHADLILPYVSCTCSCNRCTNGYYRYSSYFLWFGWNSYFDWWQSRSRKILSTQSNFGRLRTFKYRNNLV